MLRRRALPRATLAATLTLLAAALGACGGDDEEPAPAPAANCGLVAFTPNSDDGAFEIRARGVGCATARKVARASRDVAIRSRPLPRFAAEGFECAGTPTDDALPGTAYRCTRGDAVVTFTRN